MYGYQLLEAVVFKTADLPWTPAYIVSFIGGGYIQIRIAGSDRKVQ